VSLGYLFAGMLLVLAVVLAILAVFSTRLCWRLMKHHHALWVSLGSPMIGDRRFHTEMLRFLRLRRYESLTDETTKRLAAATRLASRVFLAYIFAGSAVVFGIALIGKYRKTP
jgi:hypothetical protein